MQVKAMCLTSTIVLLGKFQQQQMQMNEVVQMDDVNQPGSVYVCPMHSNVRQSSSGKCPKCGMALVPETTRFALLRHMTGSWQHLVIMAVLMVAVMAAAMMFMR